jgi:equilibrative nucleoside transporter 1/2/3
MAGQAAVAVVVNLVQLVSAAMSLRHNVGMSVHTARTPEETSAFVCFAVTTCFLCVSLFAHSWLVKTPAYKTLIVPIELRGTVGDEREYQSLLSSSSGVTRMTKRNYETTRERIIRVAKANIIYEIAVAYVFVVTLVRPFTNLLCFASCRDTIVCFPAHHNNDQAPQFLVFSASFQCNPRPPL